MGIRLQPSARIEDRVSSLNNPRARVAHFLHLAQSFASPCTALHAATECGARRGGTSKAVVNTALVNWAMCWLSLTAAATPFRRANEMLCPFVSLLACGGHDKIGARAYAKLDKKGTQQKIHISRKARIVPWIGFRTALWTIAGTPWPNFRLWRQSGVRCLAGVASWLTTPVKR